MSKKPTIKQTEQFINWITDQAITGVPPLSSAQDLAQEYLIDQSYPNNDDRIWSLINWETTKNFTSGFITGFGGLITLPVSIPAAFGASWIIQARMAGAIAFIHGHSLTSDRVRTFVLLSLLGDAANQVLKQAGIKLTTKLGEKVIGQISGKALIEINKKVGIRLLTKAGEKGIINFSKGVPVLGGVMGGFMDAASCRIVGDTAHKLFRRS